MVCIGDLHSKFVLEMFKASELVPNNAYSIIPSLFWLIFTFGLLHVQFHRFTNSFTRWRTKLYKDIIFHWTYFYISRVWFAFLKLTRWLLRYTDKMIEMNSTSEEAYINKIFTHFCIFSLVICISMIPCVLLFIRNFHRREIPNFFMWAAEDPWSRSEIGTSGHYLERPPRIEIYCPYKQNPLFRSRRSSSVDKNVYLQKEPGYFRHCKSAISIKASSAVLNN